MNLPQPNGTQRRGVAAVEFAIVSPILFLLVFASIELSRVNMILHTTTQAAYEAARSGVVPGADFDRVEAKALQVLRTAGVSNAVVTVDPTEFSESDTITVTIVVPMAGNAWIAPDFYSYPSVQGTATLNRELTGLN